MGLDPRYDDILAALGASREGSKAGLMKELTAAVEARRAAMGALAPEPRRAEDGASSARSMSARSRPCAAVRGHGDLGGEYAALANHILPEAELDWSWPNFRDFGQTSTKIVPRLANFGLIST